MGDIGGVIMGVCLGALALVLAALPIIKLVGWWIDGSIDPGLALLGLGLCIGIIAVVCSTPPGPHTAILYLLLVGTAAASPMMGEMLAKRDNAALENERMQQYAEALQIDPRNGAARMALADLLHKRGEEAHAIEHLEWMLKEFPTLQIRVRPKLESWKREQQGRQALPPVICHLCTAENAPWATECERCGAKFGTRAAVAHRVAQEGGPARILRGWALLTFVILAACLTLMWLPTIVAGPLLIAITIVGAYLFLRWVGGMGTIGD